MRIFVRTHIPGLHLDTRQTRVGRALRRRLRRVSAVETWSVLTWVHGLLPASVMDVSPSVQASLTPHSPLLNGCDVIISFQLCCHELGFCCHQVTLRSLYDVFSCPGASLSPPASFRTPRLMGILSLPMSKPISEDALLLTCQSDILAWCLRSVPLTSVRTSVHLYPILYSALSKPGIPPPSSFPNGTSIFYSFLTLLLTPGRILTPLPSVTESLHFQQITL